MLKWKLVDRYFRPIPCISRIGIDWFPCPCPVLLYGENIKQYSTHARLMLINTRSCSGMSGDKKSTAPGHLNLHLTFCYFATLSRAGRDPKSKVMKRLHSTCGRILFIVQVYHQMFLTLLFLLKYTSLLNRHPSHPNKGKPCWRKRAPWRRVRAQRSRCVMRSSEPSRKPKVKQAVIQRCWSLPGGFFWTWLIQSNFCQCFFYRFLFGKCFFFVLFVGKKGLFFHLVRWFEWVLMAC